MGIRQTIALYPAAARQDSADVVQCGELERGGRSPGRRGRCLLLDAVLAARPLLKAILSEPVVLLIDEIDRADAEFEAFLLDIQRFSGLGSRTRHTPGGPPSGRRADQQQHSRLSEALKRRCLYLFIDYPSIDQELAVVRMKVPDLSPKLARQAVEMVHNLRSLELRKSPSISETLDWAKALVTLNAR